MSPKLKSVAVTVQPDDHSPLDYLGEYRDEPGPAERTIDRAERGDMGRGELRYFVSEQAEYAEENYQRMERFVRGELASYGIRAVAFVSVAGTVQRVESPGLWGVESDAGAEHAESVASEQLHILREILDSFGIDHPAPLDAEWSDGAPWSGTVAE